MNPTHDAGRVAEVADRGIESATGRTDPAARLLLTVEEAAEMLGIGRTLAYALVSAGELPSVNLGRLRRIPVAGLRTWVDNLPATRQPLA